ncbi:hypothetical protein BC629DRAFT_414800 [Irpex lacteus]|nr:hypothetical protein BC629DRAFT_414800 [Irpex lacteus]
MPSVPSERPVSKRTLPFSSDLLALVALLCVNLCLLRGLLRSCFLGYFSLMTFLKPNGLSRMGIIGSASVVRATRGSGESFLGYFQVVIDLVEEVCSLLCCLSCAWPSAELMDVDRDCLRVRLSDMCPEKTCGRAWGKVWRG